MRKIKTSNFFRNNSSTILTIIGSVGVIATAVMSARDTVKAMNKIEHESYQAFQQHRIVNLTTKEKIKLAAPCYIPTVITGVSTILCICSANKLNKNVQKSLTSAYMLLDRSYKEYRKSVKELHGEDGERDIIKNISDRQSKELKAVDSEGTDVFFDFFGLRFFNSNQSAIREAEEAANEMLRMHGYVSLGTMYSFLGVDVHGEDDSLGWSIGAGKLYDYDSIKIDIDEAPMADGTKCYAIDFVNSPTADYLDL